MRLFAHTPTRALAVLGEGRVEQLSALEDERAAQRCFDEARFAFEQALETWPMNERAADGKDAAHVAMAQRELARGRFSAAEHLLASVRAAPSSLVDAVAARRALEHKRARDVDVRVGSRSRAVAVSLMGVAWAAVASTAHFYVEHAFSILIVYQVATTLAVLGGGFVLRRSLTTTLSRQLAVTLFTGVLFTTALWIAGWAAGWTPAAVVACSHLIVALGFLAMLVFDRRLGLPIGLQLLAFVLELLWPSHALLVAGLVGGPSLALAGWVHAHLASPALADR